MPTDDSVRLKIGDKDQSLWDSYEIDSDLMTPADAWGVTIGMGGKDLPDEVVEGAAVQIYMGKDLVMTGSIDDIDHPVSKTSNSISLSGRDMAADLLDSAAPIFDAKMVSLDQAVSKIVSEFHIVKKRISAESPRIREKITVEPGDSAWDVLARVAEANGLWPWFEPDGTLVIGGPDYSTPVVATLIMRSDGQGNNVLRMTKSRSQRGRYSKVTVLGQAAGTDVEDGRNSLSGAAEDSGVTRYRPKIVVDHECDNQATCRDRARKLIADSRLNAFTLTVEVKGHRIDAPELDSNGLLWTPGQRILVYSEPHKINGIFFLMRRKFKGDRSGGKRTTLVLKEDGVWVLDAHPHKRKHRVGKNDPGEIIDVTGGAK
jgi:prophage tail gpP-like protein